MRKIVVYFAQFIEMVENRFNHFGFSWSDWWFPVKLAFSLIFGF